MRRITCSMILAAAVLGCGPEASVTKPNEQTARVPTFSQYDVQVIPATLGGKSNRANSINQRDWLAGFALLPDNLTRHAALWREGQIQDLNTLGGPNSSVVWPGQNHRGTIVGISETAESGTLGEDWSCSAFFSSVTNHICLGFVWKNGVMAGLPTLGGENGYAAGVNDRDDVVGWAETPVHDPTCNAPQVLQFRAVLWDASGTAHELRPLPGDSTSAATAINNRGQVVGISGDCDVAVGEFSARHAVLWNHGEPVDIGNLGGVAWNTPTAINEAGDVVGFSDPPGDDDGSFIAHAFLWTRQGGIQDLGVLPGDEISEALGINARGQIVGISCGNICRAFIWQNGVMQDLNDLAGPGWTETLVSARDINDDGRITGDVSTSGGTRPYFATPSAVTP